jgi:predicted secreted acid phosphatase
MSSQPTRLSRLRRYRPGAAATAAAATVVTALALTVPSAVAGHSDNRAHAVPPPPAQPTSASQIQNVDQVKTAIKAYYGDTVTTTLDPVNHTTPLHEFSQTGAYAKEVTRLTWQVHHYLAKRAHHSHNFDGNPALVFDIDDTTLTTYDYEIYSNFVYNPDQNKAFVNAAAFPATPGMVNLVTWARDHGYTVFFLTGRPEDQRPGTLTNLTNAGYAPVSANTFLKDQTLPWLTSCTPTCTSEQYKTLTRQHLEDTGYDIVANLGDQFSDLRGGFADRPVKVPNPMYFIP